MNAYDLFGETSTILQLIDPGFPLANEFGVSHNLYWIKAGRDGGILSNGQDVGDGLTHGANVSLKPLWSHDRLQESRCDLCLRIGGLLRNELIEEGLMGMTAEDWSNCQEAQSEHKRLVELYTCNICKRADILFNLNSLIRRYRRLQTARQSKRIQKSDVDCWSVHLEVLSPRVIVRRLEAVTF